MTKTANQQLVDYLKSTISQGYTEDDLRKTLLDYGYESGDVEDAMAEATGSKSPLPGQAGTGLQAGTAATQSTSPKAGIKRRNPVLVLVLTIITLGIYGIYWYIVTTKELRLTSRSAPNPWLLMVSLVPVINLGFMFYYDWKYSRAINELTGYDTMTLFLIWVIMPPAAMYIAQQELNTKAE